jgi:hypothetical protein
LSQPNSISDMCTGHLGVSVILSVGKLILFKP